MRSLPDFPQDALSFNKEIHFTELKNDSSLSFHPAENDGNHPQRLFAPKREEPSLRTVALSKYFSL